MGAGMGIIGLVVVLSIYVAALLQTGGAIVAADHLTWILGAGILAAGGSIAAKAAL